RAPKISASFSTAVRPSACARTRSSTISRQTAGDWLTSVACRTLISLFICLITCTQSFESTSTTMVMRESSGSSVRATVKLSMSKPLAPSSPVTRSSAPGLFSINNEITCSICLFRSWHGHRLRRPHHHLVDRAAGRHHWIHVLVGRHFDVEQIWARLADGFFERGSQLMGLVDRASFEAVGAGQLFSVRETFQGRRAEAIVVEQLLPLPDHAEIAVVHDDDLDRQAVLGYGRQLRNRHLESA